MREFERCSTTAIDAYLSPLLGRYLGSLAEAAEAAELPRPVVMQSSGGVADASDAARAGAWSVLSGPAGGAVGAGLIARAGGDGDAIGLDMGGTSCDVCVVEDGEVRRTDSREVEGRVVQLPMVDVHTVGAGGGSIGWRDAGGALRVGPRSAGADPGPACYGRGGTEPTVTDANLLLGVLAPASTLAGGVALDADAAGAAVAGLAASLDLDELETAEGIVRIANQEMVRALRVVTVERGRRPAPLRAAPVRRRRADARRRDRGGARDRPNSLPAGWRGPLGSRPLRLGPPPRHDPDGDAERRGPDRPSGSRRRSTRLSMTLAAASRARSRRSSMRCATPARRSSCRSRAALAPIPPTSSSASSAPTRSATGTATPTARSSSSTSGSRSSPPGRGRRPAAAPAGDLLEGGREIRFDGEWLQTPVLRGEPPAGLEAEGPVVFELPEATFVVPPGWSAAVEETGTIRAEAHR